MFLLPHLDPWLAVPLVGLVVLAVFVFLATGPHKETRKGDSRG